MAGNDDADVLGRARASGDFIDFQKPPGTYAVEVVCVSTTVGTKFQSDEEETKLVFDLVPVDHTRCRVCRGLPTRECSTATRRTSFW